MQQENDNKGHGCKPISQTVMAFLKCLNLRHSSSSSDMGKAKSRNEEEEASSVETSTRSLNVMSKRRSKRINKQQVSSGKRGGVNNYDM